ncbi:MAG: hypothetical protein F4Z31_06110 [Gemmatimonadetes bacterium]|nr:hypothetical protein [Gemmatimonadota bacterium]MYA41307.1 hypothetical protein [Gemmatimonadota bacterium]MYE95420.1 hypothetical protein [Gemmatimonadota bacterium]MYJ12578.1 hypothetical protein [Gemmatimonadota bacterium]
MTAPRLAVRGQNRSRCAGDFVHGLLTRATFLALVALSYNLTAVPRIAAQTTVESDSPREADLVLSNEPLLRIGMLDGPEEYLFGNISGAVRLGDGSVVVADEQGRHVRMFDAGGEHVWTSGREGEGPGEYRGLWLLRGCPGAAVTVYDWRIKRITELDSDGSVVDTRGLRGTDGPGPYGAPACSPGGDLVFTDWPEAEEDLAVGEFRWEMSLSRERDDAVATLRSGIPGTDLYHHGGGISGPVTWGKDMAFAVTATGVWYGSADDYQLEHVDWTGRVTRVARWNGPDLEVTREHLDRYLDSQMARFETAEERRSFETERWPGIRDGLPERFPAFAAKGLLPLSDGSVWVVPHSSRALGDAEFHLLGADGTWLHRLTIPAGRTLLDAGPGWVLVLEEGELDEQSVAVYELVDGS